MNRIEIGKVYRHFKGKIYLVLDVALDVDSLKEKVVYKALYGDNKVWIRDIEDFLSEVGERPNNDNVTGQKYRFERYDV